MTTSDVNILDVVALTEALPQHQLARGKVGTVVEKLAPGVFDVDCADDGGKPFAMLPLRQEQLLVLRYGKVEPRRLTSQTVGAAGAAEGPQAR